MSLVIEKNHSIFLALKQERIIMVDDKALWKWCQRYRHSLINKLLVTLREIDHISDV